MQPQALSRSSHRTRLRRKPAFDPIEYKVGRPHRAHHRQTRRNAPIAEYFPPVEIEVGKDLFCYIFKGEPPARDRFIELDDSLPGHGPEIDETALAKFKVIE
jgi:hypothetical protein